MPLRKVEEAPARIPRMWALVSYPIDGKSTFATQMRHPLFVIDSDNRFSEVEHLAKGSMILDRSDAKDVLAIRKAVTEECPKNTGTVVVDTVTSIISPLVAEGQAENERKLNTNKSAAFIEKANACRLLCDTVSHHGTDTLFLWHLYDGKMDGRDQVKESIPETERERFFRQLNMKLEIVRDHDRRGIRVIWARNGSVVKNVIWDDVGYWKGMPELIEAEVYGLPFKTLEEAIAWAVTLKTFATSQEATEGYAEVKAKAAPKSAAEMWRAWHRRCLTGVVPAGPAVAA